VKKEMSLCLRIKLDIRDNGKVTLDMVSVFKFGQMGQNMKDTGKITRHMDKELSGMYMETNMTVTGKEIKHTE
jgi:hypothetical protein